MAISSLVLGNEERRLKIPSPVIFMYGYSDDNYELRKSDWEKVIDSSNVIEGITDNAEFVKKLRLKGKIFAYHVELPKKIEDYDVESIVLAWSKALDNTLNGELPEGFDAICIDEFHSYKDGNNESNVSIEALKQIREKYKDRLIFASGVWKLGNSGSISFKNKGSTFDNTLNAINKYADIFILENYQKIGNPQLYLFDSLARNLKNRIPGLVDKIIYALYISQNRLGDDKPGNGLHLFLEKQMDMAINSTALKPTKGIAFWIFYRAQPETIDVVSKLVREKFYNSN